MLMHEDKERDSRELICRTMCVDTELRCVFSVRVRLGEVNICSVMMQCFVAEEAQARWPDIQVTQTAAVPRLPSPVATYSSSKNCPVWPRRGPGCRVLAAAGGFLHCSNIGAGLLAVAGSLPGGVSPVSTVSTLECLQCPH